MVRSNVRYPTPREDWAQLIAAPRTAPKDVAAVGDDVACKFSLRPIIDGRTERLTEARSYKHSSRPSAWIGQQVQTQATFLAYIDAFWALAVLSFAAVPLALFLRVATTLTLVYTGSSVLSENVCAQAIDFSQIDAFESLGTGTLRGASPPKTIVDDDKWHTIFITIWESDTDAKAYWKSLDGNLPRTTIISGLVPTIADE